MRKLKFVSFIGSKRGNNGNTGKVVNRITNILKEELNSIEFVGKILNTRNEDIEFCIGCKSCFSKGICPIDSKDSMNDIKQEMLDADIIILSTPVYANAVSGYTKNFIDRISYWTHLMHLAGKMCIVVITAQGNGVNETANYMYEIASFLGMTVIGIVYQSNMHKFNSVDSQTRIIAARILTIINNGYEVQSNEFLEGKFKIYKSLFQEIYKKSNSTHYEANFWFEKGYLSYGNFQELINKSKNHRK
ncbi:flavodoxin family protein [Bacillus paranthracis]|uniref:flavodoxin family protein n=1 Tax=Bacillus paranthracis TaxID=2026186 RepID=UPI000200F77E|nr:flavodoxin family protein [Bacillus paranthracis]ADY20439.1 NADPH-dependent FMN reductase [Bacillus thuringiensis serovar finitimus YBT-020]MRC72916.1 hypothetical protein [Bacillus thuringiensis]OTX71375.1 hypothetical protein BK722_13275 [Bacillus thuringiensis serovar finitimus]MCR6799292.1 flavodoxin family protein [Bacillus paranthracis]MEC3358549.1 flavodoxin family protein [Bacillus paranthracis]